MQPTGKIIAPKYYSFLMILFIFADVMCDNFIFRTFNNQPHTIPFFLFLGLSIMQILASPIQAGFSEFYGRKEGLLVSLSFSLVSLCLIYFYNQQIIPFFLVLILIMLIKGGIGNTTPLSWTAIADAQETNFRFIFGASTAGFAGAYLILICANKFTTEQESNISLICLFSVLILFCAIQIKNLIDKKTRKLIEKSVDQKNTEPTTSRLRFRLKLFANEIMFGVNELKYKHIRQALAAFILWETSLYSILLLYVDFDIAQFASAAIAMMSGYLTGVVILKFVASIKDTSMIKIGYSFSTISLIPFLLAFPFMDGNNFTLVAICYFFHALGNAFLCPTLFAMLAKEKKLTEHGPTYGLVGSADTVSFLFASAVVMVYKDLELNLIYIILFSFITVAISWFPYKKFEEIKPKILKN
jgi:hypothetical protein